MLVEKEIYIEKSREFVFNQAEFARLGLSKRELEVLQFKRVTRKHSDHFMLVSDLAIKSGK